ncbi:MAG: alpha/beta hydrolase [Candidatus Lokiarchaeota archaeon]|nr:alpha/beta hydrolase [Candidatus Lokiarchaeota archaeon]
MLIKIKDIEMYYESHGRGTPLIMIPGYAVSSEMWSPFWKRLLDFYQVILIDNRGTGRSDAPNIEYSIRMMADDLVELMDAINIPKAHILGGSMGGMIAQELVLNYSEKVLSLILGMTSCGGPHSVQISEEVQRKMQTAANPPQDMSKEEVMELTWSMFYSPSYIEQNRGILTKETMSIKYPTSLIGKWRQAQAVQNWEGSYDRLSNIKVPTLVMGGENDVIFPPENFRILAEKIPGADLHVLKDAPHAFTREKEEQVVAVLLEFLGRI